MAKGAATFITKKENDPEAGDKKEVEEGQERVQNYSSDSDIDNILGESEDSIDEEIRQRKKEKKEKKDAMPMLEVEKEMLKDKNRLKPKEKEKLKDIINKKKRAGSNYGSRKINYQKLTKEQLDRFDKQGEDSDSSIDSEEFKEEVRDKFKDDVLGNPFPEISKEAAMTTNIDTSKL